MKRFEVHKRKALFFFFLRTRVGDDESGNTEVLTGSSSEADIVTVVVVNTALGEHGVVLNLRLAEGRAVVGDDDQLSYK